MKTSGSDKGTTALLSFAIISTIVLVLCSYPLNKYNILSINNSTIYYLGLIFVLLGMAIRIIAVLTLREHYTKTLQIIETHKIISNGIYSIIRHPGYLGVMTFLIGCGLLPGNLISITLIILIVPSFYSKRIKVEEQMLLDNFKEDYEKYMERTYRLIPFIY
ncbi:MAG: isoprenylcysteine carboxylmethyltransferase family protein [Ignavibacteriaceae bacterium]